MKEALERVVVWLLISSADPNKVSLAVKGALLSIVPILMLLANVVHVELGQEQLTSLFDGIAMFVQAALTVVGTAMMVYGFARKIFLSLTGQIEE